MNKLSIILLFTSLNVLIYSCPNSSSNKNNSSSGKDNNNCKYEIYFDKEFLNDKNLVVKNKEIEECYVAVKNGAEHKEGKSNGFFEKVNFTKEFFNNQGLMRIYESGNKLKLRKVTKDKIENNAIYILSGRGGNTLCFVIFKDINKAIILNESYNIVIYNDFRTYISKLLSK